MQTHYRRFVNRVFPIQFGALLPCILVNAPLPIIKRAWARGNKGRGVTSATYMNQMHTADDIFQICFQLFYFHPDLTHIAAVLSQNQYNHFYTIYPHLPPMGVRSQIMVKFILI